MVILTNVFFDPTSTIPDAPIVNLIDSYTLENTVYQQTTSIPPIIDGIIYRKRGNVYYVRRFTGDVNAGWFNLIPGEIYTNQLQHAVDTAKSLGKNLFIPAGSYAPQQVTKVPNNFKIIGAGAGITVFDNQWIPTTEGVFENLETDVFAGFSLEGISFIKNPRPITINVLPILGGIERCNFKNIYVQGAEYFLKTNRLFQASELENIFIDVCDIGFIFENMGNNHNYFKNITFSRCKKALTMTKGESNKFINCRIEGFYNDALPSVSEFPQLYFDNVSTTNFDSCYFESINPKILEEVNSRNSISFTNCHFTGAQEVERGPWKSFIFESDGILEFRNCEFGEIEPIFNCKTFINNYSERNFSSINFTERSPQRKRFSTPNYGCGNGGLKNLFFLHLPTNDLKDNSLYIIKITVFRAEFASNGVGNITEKQYIISGNFIGAAVDHSIEQTFLKGEDKLTVTSESVNSGLLISCNISTTFEPTERFVDLFSYSVEMDIVNNSNHLLLDIY
ncbi:hypothetical protein IW15_12275 [Chryseobacterium soli]|uniref:Right handed beta helix domain-containing protein n=1 Tax=Chryseobacterium soli TaxID=445961 RepID=A0A086A6L4_9FLAO|nr:right-handed parallel beta-helix repeat-containing protein [Chryseobacterium soli]KFF12328.1 hypothetical protein IW15_12275 [Chryseobacterium soli]